MRILDWREVYEAFPSGSVRVRLNLSPKSNSIADLVPIRESGEIDSINTFVVDHTSGLRVLLAPPSPEMAETITPTIAKQVLEAMGKTIEHFGPAGSGQATKATNQIMVAGIIRACAEAMAFAGAHGLPLDKVHAALRAAPLGAPPPFGITTRAPPRSVRCARPAACPRP